MKRLVNILKVTLLYLFHIAEYLKTGILLYYNSKYKIIKHRVSLKTYNITFKRCYSLACCVSFFIPTGFNKTVVVMMANLYMKTTVLLFIS